MEMYQTIIWIKEKSIKRQQLSVLPDIEQGQVNVVTPTDVDYA